MRIYDTEMHSKIILDKMDTSQSKIEKYAYDVINHIDQILGVMNETTIFLDNLIENGASKEKILKIQHLKELLNRMKQKADNASELAHNCESEVENQQELVNNIRQIMDYLYASN